MKTAYLIILIVLVLVAGILIGTYIPSNSVEDNINNIADETKEMPNDVREVSIKYLQDKTYCELDADCIFNFRSCNAINKYYINSSDAPAMVGDPACNQALPCGLICTNNKCEIKQNC